MTKFVYFVIFTTLIALAIVSIFIKPAIAANPTVGSFASIQAGCTTKAAIEVLIEMTKRFNDEGYNKVMDEPSVDCYDSRHDTQPTIVKLVRVFANYTREDGMKVVVWVVKNKAGIQGWTWFFNEEEEEGFKI